MKKEFKFSERATNVYRTKHFIVKQVFGIHNNRKIGKVAISYDTYYKRTLVRDYLYDQHFSERKNLNGKRLVTSMYVRTYID